MNRPDSQRFFRLVCTKQQIPMVESLLKAEGFEFETSQLHSLIRCLYREPFSLGSSLAYYFGYIYIQNKSSLLPPIYLLPQSGETVLDMCASPGGKTSFLAQLVGNSGLVVANEPKVKRLNTLRENLRHMNLLQTVTTNYPGERFPVLSQGVDKILLDVPCSGWGATNRPPEDQQTNGQKRLRPLIRLQKDLLGRAYKILNPGGKVLYSTCTTNVWENEQQILWACNRLGFELLKLSPVNDFVWEPAHLDTGQGCLRVCGPKSGGHSFFLACLQKKEQTKQAEEKIQAKLNHKLDYLDIRKEQSSTIAWDNLPPGLIKLDKNKMLFAPNKATQDLGQDVHWQGTFIGRKIKNRLKLDPRCRILMPEKNNQNNSLVFNDTEKLRNFINGQSLTLPDAAEPLGLYWHDLPLAWLTVKGRRVFWTDRF